MSGMLCEFMANCAEIQIQLFNITDKIQCRIMRMPQTDALMSGTGCHVVILAVVGELNLFLP